jgi:hypothetical protein
LSAWVSSVRVVQLEFFTDNKLNIQQMFFKTLRCLNCRRNSKKCVKTQVNSIKYKL